MQHYSSITLKYLCALFNTHIQYFVPQQLCSFSLLYFHILICNCIYFYLTSSLFVHCATFFLVTLKISCCVINKHLSYLIHTGLWWWTALDRKSSFWKSLRRFPQYCSSSRAYCTLSISPSSYLYHYISEGNFLPFIALNLLDSWSLVTSH